MFHRNKIMISFIAGILMFVGGFYVYSYYQEYKLEEYISKVDMSKLDNDVLYLERYVGDDIVVSIDTVVFKLELDKMVYEISSDFDVEYISLDRYSNNIEVRYKYKNKSKIMKYELIRAIEKTGDWWA